MNRETVGGAGLNRALLTVPTLPVRQVSMEQLQERLQSTVRVENQAAAIRAEVVAEMERRRGTALAEAALREDALLPRRRSRSEVETARQLQDLPKTWEGLQSGEISFDNARIIAGAARRGEIDEGELADLAKTLSPDKFAAAVRKHEQARSADDGVSKLEHQRSRRFARIKTDIEDGMTVMYGRFDPVTGARIETAVSQMMNRLWHKEDSGNRATAGQRMADAMARLLTREGNGRPQNTRLLVMADFDTVSGQLGDPRLEDGTPVPAGTLRRLACDAQILPAIFAGPSVPLDLGRARRTASGPQRAALVARDKRCIGCGAKASWCQAHHIKHWQDGGPTDLDNMCLLCSRCHHKVHDQDWTVHKAPTGRYFLRRPPKRIGRPPRQVDTYRRRRTRRSRRRRPIKQRK